MKKKILASDNEKILSILLTKLDFVEKVMENFITQERLKSKAACSEASFDGRLKIAKANPRSPLTITV